MEIRSTTIEDSAALIRYQIKMYPERGTVFPFHYLSFWFSKHDDADKSFIIEDSGVVYGQDLFSSMTYWYQGEKTDGVWEFDLIVDESLRKDNWGLDLLMAALNRYEHIFATGSNDTALKIHRKLGKSFLGELRKYVLLINPLYLPIAFFKGNVLKQSFPAEVEIDGATFDNVDSDAYPELMQPFNSNLLEFGRDKDYLNWRYGQLHEYVFYRQRGSTNYFVVRTIIKSHITALVIVDFRCELSECGQYQNIVKAAINIAKYLRLPVLITGSSLALTDSVLEDKGFKSVGRPRPIIGKDERFIHHKEVVDARNFCLVTLADSDGEVNW